MDILNGKKGIIFGAVDEHSLAWHVAVRCVECGASVVLTNKADAIRLGSVASLAASRNLPLIPCDATDTDDIAHLLEEAQRLLGGKIDFILHAVAMSQNLRRHRAYDDLNYNYFQQTLDVSALSLHKILQTAKHMDALAEWGSVVTLTYLASERSQFGYNDMADAKAMLESIVRNFGQIYGAFRHVRVNALSQSPTPTRAAEGFDRMVKYRDIIAAQSPLGLADADDCADACVLLFSDFARKITMQTLYNDGGFSQTLISPVLFTENKYNL